MVAYEQFISEIYDSSPFFGQDRTREMATFNAPYLRHLAGETGRLLELGSATGNLTLPLALAGHHIDSVDISPYMQEVLARKLAAGGAPRGAVTQLLADATTLRGPAAPYRSIVMPEGIFIAIASVESQMALLHNCHRNLAPRGQLYFDFFQPDYQVIHEGKVTQHSRFRAEDGTTYILTADRTNDPYSQVQQWTMTYTRMIGGAPGEVIVVDLAFRYVFASECRLMLEAAGFRVVEINTDYAGRRGFFVVAERL